MLCERVWRWTPRIGWELGLLQLLEGPEKWGDPGLRALAFGQCWEAFIDLPVESLLPLSTQPHPAPQTCAVMGLRDWTLDLRCPDALQLHTVCEEYAFPPLSLLLQLCVVSQQTVERRLYRPVLEMQ